MRMTLVDASEYKVHGNPASITKFQYLSGIQQFLKLIFAQARQWLALRWTFPRPCLWRVCYFCTLLQALQGLKYPRIRSQVRCSPCLSSLNIRLNEFGRFFDDGDTSSIIRIDSFCSSAWLIKYVWVRITHGVNDSITKLQVFNPELCTILSKLVQWEHPAYQKVFQEMTSWSMHSI